MVTRSWAVGSHACLTEGNETSVLKEMETKQFHGSYSFFTKQRHHLVQRTLVMGAVRWDGFGFFLVVHFAVITGSSVPPISGGYIN